MNVPTQQTRNQPQGQRTQQARQPRHQQQQGREPEDFFGDLRNAFVELTLHNGQQVRGVLNKVSRFQIGLLINGEQVYGNKGFIVTIKPLQLPTGQPSNNGNTKR